MSGIKGQIRQHGVTDFDQYAMEPGHDLMPDFFLD